MTNSQVILNLIEQIPENELIFASKLYKEKLKNQVSEDSFYQTLGRLRKSGKLSRIAKGTYYRPKISKYGIVPPSEKEIISAFTESNSGTVIGYTLYNNLKLTTQLPQKIEVLSSRMDQQTRNISNVLLQFCDLVYTPNIESMIHMLEVLQNFEQIQDLNSRCFIEYCKNFVSTYNDATFKVVNTQKKYQKRTISFLKNILEFYNVSNELDRYLSTMSDYKHPTMEEIYETAQLSQ